MELPKNITQIGETNPHCKIYVEDYVISYIKQLNSYASDKALAVALYGIRKEENGITYLFFYGAGKLNFLQRECRHLSQAVLQEVEKQRVKYFPEYTFLGYKLLDGEMVEGFYVCEQNVCRSIEGYAQFYEKNDRMLAFMLEERQGESTPEKVDQDKYNIVKKRQEERRAHAEKHTRVERHASAQGHARGEGHVQAEAEEGHASGPRIRLPNKEMAVPGNWSLRNMRLAAAAAFVLLGVVGLAAMGNGERLDNLQTAAREWMEKMTEKQLPDMVEVSNGSAQAGTIVAEDKLTDAILKENAAAGSSQGQDSSLEPSSPKGTEQNGSSAEESEIPSMESGQSESPDSSESSGINPDGSGQLSSGSVESSGTDPGQPDSGTTEKTAAEESPETVPDDSGQTSSEETETDGTNLDQSSPDSTEDKPAAPETDDQPELEPVSYTIQKGDTLIGICIKRYGSDKRVAEICALNNIGNPDDIKEGAKILLP